LNKENKQFVLVHRGTDFELDFEVSRSFNPSGVQNNIEGILMGDDKSPYHQKSQEALKKAIEYCQTEDFKNYALSFTGHSLGAW